MPKIEYRAFSGASTDCFGGASAGVTGPILTDPVGVSPDAGLLLRRCNFRRRLRLRAGDDRAAARRVTALRVRGLQDRVERHALQPRRFVDGEMIDARFAGDIDILQLAVEARARPHIGIFALRQIEHAGDVLRRVIGTGAVEGHDQRHRHALRIEALRHLHHGVGAKRVADKDVRAVITGVILGDNLRHHRVGDGVIVNVGRNTVALDLGGELIHAEREDVEEPAHQIDMRMRRFGVGRRRLGCAVSRLQRCGQRQTCDNECRGKGRAQE